MEGDWGTYEVGFRPSRNNPRDGSTVTAQSTGKLAGSAYAKIDNNRVTGSATWTRRNFTADSKYFYGGEQASAQAQSKGIYKLSIVQAKNTYSSSTQVLDIDPNGTLESNFCKTFGGGATVF